jgi:NitT/TauT family transport system substrate-binding protein
VATGGQDLASDDIQLVTLEGSDVKTAADLAGKTIALPQLGGAAELTVRELARQNGVDQGSLKFAQLNFPDMPPALRAGRIDAAYLSEPFLAQIKGQTKIRALGSGATAIAPELPLAAVVTTEAYAKKNPELIAAFRRANKRSADYAVAHPDELLEYVPDALGVPKEVAAQIIPPQVNATIDEAKLQKMGDLMFEYKQIPKRVDVHDFVRQDAQ